MNLISKYWFLIIGVIGLLAILGLFLYSMLPIYECKNWSQTVNYERDIITKQIKKDSFTRLVSKSCKEEVPKYHRIEYVGNYSSCINYTDSAYGNCKATPKIDLKSLEQLEIQPGNSNLKKTRVLLKRFSEWEECNKSEGLIKLEQKARSQEDPLSDLAMCSSRFRLVIPGTEDVFNKLSEADKFICIKRKYDQCTIYNNDLVLEKCNELKLDSEFCSKVSVENNFNDYIPSEIELNFLNEKCKSEETKSTPIFSTYSNNICQYIKGVNNEEWGSRAKILTKIRLDMRSSDENKIRFNKNFIESLDKRIIELEKVNK